MSKDDLPPPDLDLLKKIGEKGWQRYVVDAPRPSREIQEIHILLLHGFVSVWGRAEQFLPDDENDHVEAQITDIGSAELAKRYATHNALFVRWSESEVGWGVRPDGITLHATQNDVKSFIKDYWHREESLNPSGVVPEEYTRQDSNIGRPAKIDEELYKRLASSKNGIRLPRHDEKAAEACGRIILFDETRI